jgi:hypothetical protein
MNALQLVSAQYKDETLRSTLTAVDMIATIESFRAIVPAELDKARLPNPGDGVRRYAG